jgi:hypothetical protein
MPGSLELDQLDAQMPYWLGPARPPEPRELSPRPRRARGRTSLGLGTHAALRSSPVARRNKTGAAPTPCGKARCGPGNLPRRTAFDVSARSPRAREATMASPAAPDDPDLLAQLRGRRRRAVKADEQGGGSSRPGPPLEPGRSAASPPLSPRESPRLPGVFHPRSASTSRVPAVHRPHARAIRPERAVSSPRCERQCNATPAGTPSGRKPGLGRLLLLSLPLSRPASCRRRSAYLSLSSETVGRQGRRK